MTPETSPAFTYRTRERPRNTICRLSFLPNSMADLRRARWDENVVNTMALPFASVPSITSRKSSLATASDAVLVESFAYKASSTTQRTFPLPSSASRSVFVFLPRIGEISSLKSSVYTTTPYGVCSTTMADCGTEWVTCTNSTVIFSESLYVEFGVMGMMLLLVLKLLSRMMASSNAFVNGVQMMSALNRFARNGIAPMWSRCAWEGMMAITSFHQSLMRLMSGIAPACINVLGEIFEMSPCSSVNATYLSICTPMSNRTTSSSTRTAVQFLPTSL